MFLEASTLRGLSGWKLQHPLLKAWSPWDTSYRLWPKRNKRGKNLLIDWNRKKKKESLQRVSAPIWKEPSVYCKLQFYIVATGGQVWAILSFIQNGNTHYFCIHWIVPKAYWDKVPSHPGHLQVQNQWNMATGLLVNFCSEKAFWMRGETSWRPREEIQLP